MKFLTVPTHWQCHLPVPWWTPSAHRWRHVLTVSSCPSKQTFPSPHILTQILLKSPIHTNHCFSSRGAGCVTTTTRNKLPPATCLKLCSDDWGNYPRKDHFYHVIRQEPPYRQGWELLAIQVDLNGLLQSVASITKEDCREMISQARFHSILPV